MMTVRRKIALLLGFLSTDAVLVLANYYLFGEWAWVAVLFVTVSAWEYWRLAIRPGRRRDGSSHD